MPILGKKQIDESGASNCDIPGVHASTYMCCVKRIHKPAKLLEVMLLCGDVLE